MYLLLEKNMKVILITSLLFLGAIFLFILWAAYPWSLSAKNTQTEIVVLDDVTIPDPDLSHLSMITWNMAFAYGVGSEGKGYTPRTRDEYSSRLAKMAEKLKTWNADVVCIQEIDFASSRSHSINQAQFLAREAGYKYVAEAVSWDLNYVPFPYWPLSYHFGRINSGGAILSRYPLIKNEVHLFEKPASKPWWYNWFYLHRYWQKVKVQVGEASFDIINLHLEAFDTVDRDQQVLKLKRHISRHPVQFVMGDFNTVPSTAQRKDKFSNSEEDYTTDKVYLHMSEMMNEAIPIEIYNQTESDYWTFPSTDPDRRLDYIFYQRGQKLTQAAVLKDAGDLSDHLPFKASFQISDPKFNPYSQ